MTAEVRPALFVLMAAIGLLLAAATANVASLQLVRATARRRELAVRSALGAAAGRLARLLLAETVILGVLGGTLGLLLAVVAQRSLPALLPAGFPRMDAVAIDVRVARFCAALSLASGIGAGLLPALFVRRLHVGAVLAEDGPTSVGAGRGGAARARNIILAGQVAVATVLLLGALQLGRSFFAMLHAERGYDADRLLVVRLPMPEPAYTAQRREQLVSDLLERLRNLPGVAEAAGADILPMSGYWAVRAFTLTSPTGVVRQVNASVNHVSPGYFRALGRKVHEGRPLLDTDTATSPPVVVVNRTFARHYLDGHALGALVPGDGRQDGSTVVGVVDDLVQKSVKDEPQPEILIAWSQSGGGLGFPEPSIVIRVAGDPAALAANVRGLLQQLDPTLAPSALVPMQQLLSGSLAQPRLYAVLLASFAVCAAVVMGVGLLGSLSYGVALRTREIGLRLALGARPVDVVLMIAAQTLRIVGAGLAVGLAASLALGRTIAVLLYGVSEHDPLSFSTVPFLVLMLAACASVGPALRAARMDPLRALRNG
jgi:putative ABC transport system permease protein